MPSISGIPVIATKDSSGTTVLPVNLALRFSGASVTVDGPAQSLITISGGGGSGWLLTGNIVSPGDLFGSINAQDIIAIYGGAEVWRYGISTMTWASSTPGISAMSISRFGKFETLGAQVRKAIRVVTSTGSVNAINDYKIILNGNNGFNQFIALPPGEEGLEFRFMDAASNTDNWFLQLAPGDVLDAIVPAPLNSVNFPVSISYHAGVWYMV
ncbi:MAG: hypothetical protein LLG04_10565 [Parachlamydia sp.]|nr:hypothetical protein [Parachlamydia sp.]